MAAPKPEIDIIKEGMSLSDPYNNQVFIQNLYKSRGLYETREGFGTLQEFSAPLSARAVEGSVNNNEFGLQKHLGSFSFTTSFGHEQIVSVFLARGWAGYTPALKTDYVDYYCVNIYDVTTDNFWQEVLYDHTSEQNKENLDVNFYKAYLEARPPLINYQQVKIAVEETFFFAEYLDKVYFGSKEAGMFVYNPAAFITNRDKRVNNINNRNEIWDELTNHYGETSLITPLTLKDGLANRAYSYITDDELKNVVDIDGNNGRLVYASGKSIYFSDVGVPNAIIGNNVFTLHEMRGEIKAIKTFNEMVIIWSEDQTFVYQPSQGLLLSAGRLVEVQSEIGCLGPNAVLFRGNRIWWVDRNGVYSTGTGFSAEELSLPIKKFFTDSTINPFIHYFTSTGFANTNPDSPDFVYRFRDFTNGAHLTFDEVYEQLIFVVPELNLAWIFKNGWYLWSFTSIVKNDELIPPAYEINGDANISKPWITTTQTKTFAVGGQEESQVVSVKEPGGVSASTNIGKLQSFRLFEWGRGGALDGSTRDFDEGRRQIGFYETDIDQLVNQNLQIYFDPLKKWGNKLSADAAQNIVYSEEDDLWYLPIYFSSKLFTSGVHQILNYELEFRYDNTKFETIEWRGAADDSIVFMLPTERAVDYLGYSPGVIAGTAQVSDTAGVITIKHDHSLVGANASYNYISLNPFNKSPVIWIPFKKINRTNVVKDTRTSLVTEVITTNYTYGTVLPGTSHSGADKYIWNQSWVALEDSRTRTTGVDWIYKSDQLGIEGEQQVKARGSYSLINSRGTGTPITTWLYGPWNTAAGSDYKDYVTQIVDVTDTNVERAAIVEVTNKNSVRTRFKPAALQDRLLGTTATYGDNTNAATGNYLVDTEEVDTIATSDSVRGESVSYTFFGFLLDKAAKLNIRNIKVVMQAVAGRRRRGR